MTPEPAGAPLRVARTAGERMLEVVGELEQLSEMLRRDGSHAHGTCWLAGAIAWRLLVVRTMVWASATQAVLAAQRVHVLESALDEALGAAEWGRCRDLDEALSDLETVLADVAEAAMRESA